MRAAIITIALLGTIGSEAACQPIGANAVITKEKCGPTQDCPPPPGSVAVAQLAPQRSNRRFTVELFNISTVSAIYEWRVVGGRFTLSPRQLALRAGATGSTTVRVVVRAKSARLEVRARGTARWSHVVDVEP